MSSGISDDSTTEPRLGLALQAMGRELATIGYTSRLTKIATDVLEAFDAVYDRQSSGSVQHYIETGAYLTHEEAREWSTDPERSVIKVDADGHLYVTTDPDGDPS